MVQEVKKSNKKTQEAQGTTAEVEVPTISSQGMEIRVKAAKPSFAQVAGIHPSGRNWPPSQPPGNNQVLKTALENALKPKERPKSRNMFRGNSSEDSSLSADVNLVATGVAKDATEKQLEDFLKDRGISEVKVECLTKTELLNENKVRSKTMRVTVKASELDKAMKPEVWPSRVDVRHYRAPQRSSQGAGDGSWASQSAQTRLEEGSSGWRQLGNRSPRVPSSRQQQVNQPALKLLMETMFGLLGEQTFP